MNIFITLAILFANAIAITLVYQFVRGLPKMEKIIFIGVSFAIMYVMVSMGYWISGFGIKENINETLKNLIIYMFVPVNIIILIPFVARKYYKWRQNEVDKSSLIKRIIIVSIIGVLILTVETVYIKEIKKDIEGMTTPLLEYNTLENGKPSEPLGNTPRNEELENQKKYTNGIRINTYTTNLNELD